VGPRSSLLSGAGRVLASAWCCSTSASGALASPEGNSRRGEHRKLNPGAARVITLYIIWLKGETTVNKLLAIFCLSLTIFVGNTHRLKLQTVDTRAAEAPRAIDQSTRECIKGYALAYLKIAKNPNAILEKELSNCWIIARMAIDPLEMTSQEILDYLGTDSAVGARYC
jgi:hypothetical protein